jgi:hypothetical protein
MDYIEMIETFGYDFVVSQVEWIEFAQTIKWEK